MQNRCLQVVLALTSLFLSEAQDVSGSGHSCLRSSPADDGLTRVTFLRGNPAGVRSLYLTLWSEDMHLVTCEVNTDPVITERYRTLCHTSGTQDQEVTQGFNISALLAPDAPCALVSSSAPTFAGRTRTDGAEGKTRRKRAWIFPGTLWCGTGSRAAGYEQLGMFESADRCCREHDHCQHMIPAFTMNYGVFNSKFFTVSHCDCDQRFRECLLSVNDTISSMVGYSFFNILQVPCFELTHRKRCTEMYWFGMCKVAKEAPYAVFKTPRPFITSNATSNYWDNTDSNNSTTSEGPRVTESPPTQPINPHRTSPKRKHRCRSRDPPRGDTFYRRTTKGKGCKQHQKLYIEGPSQMPPISRAQATTPSVKKTLLNASGSSVLMSNKGRFGKKKTSRKSPSADLTQVTTKSYPQTLSTTQITHSSTQKPVLQLDLTTATTAATKTTKIRHKGPKQSRCCGFRRRQRGDTVQPHCKSCLGPKTNSTSVTPSTTTYGLQIRTRTLEMLRLQKTTATPKQDTLETPRSTAASAGPVATTLHEGGKSPKQVDFQLLWYNTSQEHTGTTQAQNTQAERGLKHNIALHNMTDIQRLCGSLKHLDRCEHKIPPLERKYDLQNTEPKTAYHCDCTRRSAVEIESFNQPSVLPTLLMDFVSQYCFKLPKEKKCHRRKSCSGGFTKASDLLRTLKKIEEKDTAPVRNSGNDRKRGIPVRLYKRCLRLEREADINARRT